jgi:predicted ABC-type sugar transport system permease subunit
VLGCALYLVENYIPMAPPFLVVIRVVVVLILLWFLLRLIGLAPALPR